MKLLFIGMKPSSTLEKVLLTNGFSVMQTKRAPETKTQAELIAVLLKTANGLKELVRLRQLHPQAWIAVVVEKKWLREAALASALIRDEIKNDVWVQESWEQMFWLALQRQLAHSRLARELKASQAECRQLKSLYAELSESSDRLIRQLENDVGLATNIQRSLLPKRSPEIPGVSVMVKYLPAAGLGGDYYDIFEIRDKRHFGILMADSKTHGMAAALLSVLLKTRIEEMKDRFPDSRSFVEYLNREIHQMHRKELSQIAILYGILDRASLTLRYTSAGHLCPLLWRDGKPETTPTTTNPPVGSVEHFAFRESVLMLKPGDLLIFHTDGLEAPLTERHPSAFEKMVQILKDKDPRPDPLDVQNELMALVHRSVDRKPLADDLTMIHLAIDERALYVPQADSEARDQSSK